MAGAALNRGGPRVHQRRSLWRPDLVAQVCGHNHRATPVRLSSVAIFAGELGVWVTAVQPLPQAVSKVVGLVRTTGGHSDHFLAQRHSLFHVSSIQHCLIPDARGERPAVPTSAV
jgi:hypothetical protein